MSRPTARPGTGAPCSGVRPLSTMAAPSLSPDQVPANAAGYSITTPDPHSRAEVSSLSEGHSNATAPWPWTGAPCATSGHASPHLREQPRHSDAQWQGGIVASQPHVIHLPAPTQTFLFRAPRRLRDHAQVAQPPPTLTPSTSCAITGPTRLSSAGSHALSILHGQHMRWPTRPPALSFCQG